MFTTTDAIQAGTYALSPILDLPAPLPPRHPTGKGIFIWNIPQTEAGNVDQIALKAVFSQFDWVGIKMHDRAAAWGNPIVNLDLAQALQGAGLSVWGWGYCYGDNPTGEADVVLRELARLDLAGYFIDAEHEYKHKPAQAEAFIRRLGAGTDRPIGLCSYRYPVLHPEIPWAEFLEGCDFHLPQMYWVGDNRINAPGLQLARSYEQLKARKDLPYIPLGISCRDQNWQPSVAQLENFWAACALRDLPGAGYYQWEATVRLPANWDEIASQSMWPRG